LELFTQKHLGKELMEEELLDVKDDFENEERERY
jgi:hypothetical protein